MIGDQCPDKAQLLAVLAGTLLAAESQRLTRHLDECSTCRLALEQLVGDMSPLHLSTLMNPPSPLGSQYIGALRSIQSLDGKVSPRRDLDPSSPAWPPAIPAKPVMQFGRHRILRRIGQGGMSIVYQARDPHLDRMVAIKFLRPHLASQADARRRFAREGRVAAAIRHPHVVTIFDVEEHDGHTGLVMEYVAGMSLAERIAQGPLPLADVLAIAQQLAAGLAAAHAGDVVHRDIKPANILLERDLQHVKIVDFGLARVMGDSGISASGDVLGTPEFSSPEQLLGKPLDPRSDLFSLGSVLYTLCAGRPPFAGDTSWQALESIRSGTSAPLTQFNPNVPAWFVQIIARLHEKQPQDRFQSAEDLIQTLTQGMSLAAAPPLPPQWPPALPLANANGPARPAPLMPPSTPALSRTVAARRTKKVDLHPSPGQIFGAALALLGLIGIATLFAEMFMALRVLRDDAATAVRPEKEAIAASLNSLPRRLGQQGQSQSTDDRLAPVAPLPAPPVSPVATEPSPARQDVAQPLPAAPADTIALNESWPDEYEDLDYHLPLSAEQADTLGTVNEPLRAESLVIDEQNRQLYTAFHKSLSRGPVTGKDRVLVLDGLRDPRSLCLDESEQVLYWIGQAPAGGRVIQSVNVNGGQFEPQAAFVTKDPWPVVDAKNRQLLRFERRRAGKQLDVPDLLKSNFDGKKDEVLYADRPELVNGRPGRVLGDFLYFTNGSNSGTGTTVFRARLDGSGITTLGRYFHAQFHLGLALDDDDSLYITTSQGIDRLDMNRGLTQTVVIVPGGTHDVAFDGVERKLYWIDGLHERVQCIKLPPPEKRRCEAPPWITDFAPQKAEPGDKLRITGRFLAKTNEVRFLDDGAGSSIVAEFVPLADDALEVVQPVMLAACHHPLIVVTTPSGITVTLPPNVAVMEATKPWQQMQKIDRLGRDSGFAVLLKKSVHVSDFQQQVAYVTQDCSAYSGAAGGNTFFVKNGANCICRRAAPGSRYYFEPYASVRRLSQEADADILIPVPAIRASRVAKLLDYQQPVNKPRPHAIVMPIMASTEESAREQPARNEPWPTVYEDVVPIQAVQAEVVLDASEFGLTSFAIDAGAKHLYWLGKKKRASQSGLYSLQLNANSPRLLIEGLSDPHCLAINARGRRLFWIGDENTSSVLRSAPTTGGPSQKLGSPIARSMTVAIGPSKGKIYRFDRQGNWGEIIESNLDDTEPRRIYSARPELAFPVVAAQLVGADLYFVSLNQGVGNRSYAYRAAVDGSDFTKLGEIPMHEAGHTLAVDVVGNCLYRTDQSVIQRFDFDSGRVDNVVVGVGHVDDLAFDQAGKKLYWASYGLVRRASVPPLRIKRTIVAEQVIRASVAPVQRQHDINARPIAGP